MLINIKINYGRRCFIVLKQEPILIDNIHKKADVYEVIY